MAPDEYTKAFDKALADLEDRVQRRDLLNAEIAGLRETVRVLSNRVALPPDKGKRLAQVLALVDYATPSLTDSIRSLLARGQPKEMTAIEVRNALEDSNFNFDDFSNSLAACHAALKRMLNDGEVEAGTPKEGKASYKATVFKFSRLPGHLASSTFAKQLMTEHQTTQQETTEAPHPLNRLKPRRKSPIYG